MSNIFYTKIHSNPIIAAVNHLEKLEKAIQSPCEVIFLLNGNIFNLETIVNRVKEEGMSIYIHLDLMEGFSNDTFFLKYIHECIKPHGIITTKSNLIKHAKEMNMFTIQRLFLLDTLSLETGKNTVRYTKPDAIEVLPGILPDITRNIHHDTRIPIITGGLISKKEDVINSLNAGAIGISTSNEDIWYM